ncbi:hypothetical protein VTK56DRAFT_8394 [Thermocarpiscus australiensis]
MFNRLLIFSAQPDDSSASYSASGNCRETMMLSQLMLDSVTCRPTVPASISVRYASFPKVQSKHVSASCPVGVSITLREENARSSQGQMRSSTTSPESAPKGARCMDTYLAHSTQ